MMQRFLVLACVMALAPPSLAQVANGQRPVMTEMPRPVMQSMRDWLRDRATADRPEMPFKVPAEATEVWCNINPEGIRCYESLVTLRCPTEVTVQLPGGGTSTVPVSCTGPNSDGTCDCEFREG